MHIAEGYLPVSHCLFWTTGSLPFLAGAVRRLKSPEVRERRMELAAAGGMMLLLTALKLPSLAGSSSHATGVALAAILFGPRLVSALALCVLVLQAVLMAHGGITTLGANLFSLGICGPFAAFGCYQALRRSGISPAISAATAAAFSSVAVYAVAAFQMAVAYPDPASGLFGSMLRFLAVFAWTQAPIAVAEGLLTGAVFRLLEGSELLPRWEDA
jgi:cobalt/nickel transport system permease protein